MHARSRIDNNVVNTPQMEIPTPVAQPSTPEIQAPSQDMSNAASAPASYEDMLNEKNFHDIVNQDQDMYDAIDAIPNDQDDMVNSIVAAVQKHVSEVWSPPRVTAFASEYGLSLGQHTTSRPRMNLATLDTLTSLIRGTYASRKSSRRGQHS